MNGSLLAAPTASQQQYTRLEALTLHRCDELYAVRTKVRAAAGGGEEGGRDPPRPQQPQPQQQRRCARCMPSRGRRPHYI